MDWQDHKHDADREPPYGDGRDGGNQANEDKGLLQSLKDSYCYKMFMCFIEEFCPWLTSPPLFQDSLRRAKASIRSRPVTSFLYAFLTMSGVLPVLCFTLCVCGTFLLLAVGFLLCHGVAIVIAAVVCAGMFFFIVMMSCTLAMLLGLTIHMLSAWGWASNNLSRKVSDMVQRAQQSMDKLTPVKGT